MKAKPNEEYFNLKIDGNESNNLRESIMSSNIIKDNVND
jgi:hypothetical protein